MILDSFDRKILSLLQSDGRLSLTDLAEKVGLSVSPCHRRVRALEQASVIVGYRAQLDPAKLDLKFSTIVFVSLSSTTIETISAFETAVTKIHEIVKAQRLFGDPDYILHIVCKDLTAFQQLYDERLSALPGVGKVVSTLVMKDVVQDRCLPI